MTPYYEDPAVTIWFGDCLEILPTLERVDHVITDPPYSEHVHSNVRRGSSLSDDGVHGRSRELGFDSLTDELRSRSAEWFAKLSPRWTLVFSDIESCHLWRADLQANGLDYVRTGIWHKLGSTPQFTGDRPATAFETITIVHPPGRKRWNGGGRHGWWDFDLKDAELVWDVPISLNCNSSDPRLHTTQKPLSLMKALISDFTDPGETILDPFAGIGTTGRAAKDLGRKAILVECDESYAEISARRMSQEVFAFEKAGD